VLAIRLHTDKRPTLRLGTHLSPILDWETGKIVVKRWIAQLNQDGGAHITKVRFATLVTIPEDHPIFLSLSPFTKTMAEVVFRPLCEIPAELKEQFVAWQKSFIAAGAVAITELPELIIGAPLSDSHIKWTKSVQLLYRREQNVKRRNLRRIE
jgi:hypothetical protein